jgi:hypothetical protein
LGERARADRSRSAKAGHQRRLTAGEKAVVDNWSFGVTMIVVGMGGTLATLALLSLLMVLLKRVFPYREEHDNST